MKILNQRPIAELFLMAACFFASVVVGAGAAAQKTGAVSTGSNVRIRSESSLSGMVVGHLDKGEAVSVIGKSTFTFYSDGKSDYWFEIVNSSGTRGWVFGPFLRLDLTVETYGERKMGCNHWMGEDAYNEERGQEITAALARLRCDEIEQDLSTLKKRHKNDPAILQKLEGYNDLDN